MEKNETETEPERSKVWRQQQIAQPRIETLRDTKEQVGCSALWCLLFEKSHDKIT